ncbi:tRNA (adenosine(37)-N6)-dimethylallyltransferase MiaA [Nitrosophilus alvini]|uniref:tRNA (adenosine(37)-N6)-dimethylallyltransferase MiaA n=1 Tax=Nitrosophilus alvini TaxID=2714855 RepID=UPI00190A6014|nr:tRNA (adenosine(37)-N6)-dimethylallyltransferase MiaA [Nitrosophilus alvini]
MIEIAIIGPTASGKSDLALKIAKKHNAYILSLDSLSIYKEIDIASAKPSKEELKSVRHFGIDEIYPDEYFSVERFFDIYKEAKKEALKSDKNLIIVGGTLFYLKSMIEGISKLPKISKESIQKSAKLLKNPKAAYEFLKKIDPLFAKKITPSDRYRIEKGLNIFFETGETATDYFEKHPRIALTKNIKIYEIDINRDILRERIAKRTKKMLQSGLIDEVAYLEKKYTRLPNPMGAIGIKETLEYLDGKLTKEELFEKICINTAKLAKRQQTFARTQFKDKISADISSLEAEIANSFQNRA